MSTSSCLPSNSSELNPLLLRERNLIRVLTAFLATGIFFMLIPGTLIGVLNLIQIGNLKDARAATTIWIQAHGHAQLFGWLGTFIMGIGYYSVPNLRKISSPGFYEGWICLVFWALGVALRWYAGISTQCWQILFPTSAILEFIAVSYFVYLTMLGARSSKGKPAEPWAFLVITGSLVWQILALINIPLMISIAVNESSPVVPLLVGRKFLFAAVWGWVVPVVWGLSARWLPPLLGLPEPNGRLLKSCCFLNVSAIICFATGTPLLAELILVASVLCFIGGLKVFSGKDESAKITGVHKSFPAFLKVAYLWLFVSSLLFLAAAYFGDANGVGGAARHAITVGFFSNMVFTIGPRVLPAFLGRRKIFSTRLMFFALILLNSGCALRVSAEILAYDFSISACWSLLPVSAILELSAMLLFAFNLLGTFWQKAIMDQFISEGDKTRQAV